MAPDTLCAGVSRRRLLGIGAALALTGGPVPGEARVTTGSSGSRQPTIRKG